MDQIEIDPDGDVVLICGPDNEQQRLLVCSKMLSNASPVFRSMFSPRYQEGTRLRAEGTVDIQLPEDAGENMILVCRIAHHQNGYVPHVFTTAQLLAISQLCDKYDLRDMLSRHTSCWIMTDLDAWRAKNRNVQDDTREYLLVAAYNFGHTSIFARVGRQIIVEGSSIVGRSRHAALVRDVGTELHGVFGVKYCSSNSD